MQGDKPCADFVLINGIVYTADASDSEAQAVAISSGLIIAVGSNKSVHGLIGPTTRVLDLEGKMVLPGMIDSHLHPPGLAILKLFGIELSWGNSKQEHMEKISLFIENNPDLDIYYGRGWSPGSFEGEERYFGPRRDYLDQICPDKPVILSSNDGHSMWVNSKALELAGIGDDTPDPKGGIIFRDPHTGKAWGTLAGAASDLLPVQSFTPNQLKDGILAFQELMHSLGYTGIQSVGWDHPLYDIFSALESENKLKMWVRDSKQIDIRSTESIEQQLADLFELNKRYKGNLYRVNTAKIFLDGVIESGTAKLIEPYEAALCKGDHYYGIYYWEDFDVLKEVIERVNREGLQVHLHSIGDQSTRDALDAFEYALDKVSGTHRNVITHLQLVDNADITRFKKLNIIASVQPYWHLKEPGQWKEVDRSLLGTRAEYEYPLNSLLQAGALLASSSDYPVVELPNPLYAIRAGVTRNIYNEQSYKVEKITDQDDKAYLLNSGERVSLKDMLRSFTINNAYTLFIEDSTGSIEPGKFADMVIFDKNLFAVNPVDLDSAIICYTIFHGDIVYTNSIINEELP